MLGGATEKTFFILTALHNPHLRWVEAPGQCECLGRQSRQHVSNLEILRDVRADGFEPIMAFDDRNRAVKAFRAAGVPVAQVRRESSDKADELAGRVEASNHLHQKVFGLGS